MKLLKRLIPTALALSFLVTAACSTTGNFKIPPGTKLMVTDREVTPDANGDWKTSPFFWSETGGAHYRLMNSEGKVIREGKLKTHFRVASIFWPPFALIYWPMGLHDHGFDLTRPGDGYYVVDTTPAMIARPEETATESAPAAPAPKAKKKK
jgi:hypothetical protein